MTRSEFALWAALLAAAWSTGFLASQARGSRGLSRVAATSVFVTGALLAWAWATLAGALLRADPATAVAGARLAIESSAPLRLASITSGIVPACITAATVLAFVSIVMLGGSESHARQPGLLHRLAAIGGVTAVLLTIAIVSPALVPVGADFTSVPLNLVHPGAALASVATLGSLIVLAIATTWILAVRSGGTPASVGDDRISRLTMGAWMLASIALVADQWSRTALTLPLTPGVPVPRNAGGVTLWLVLGALTHARVRGLVIGKVESGSQGPRWPTHLVHIGAAAMVVAFAAHIVATRTSLTLAPAGAVPANDVFHRAWTLVNQGISRFDVGETDVAALAVDVASPSGRRGLLTPELRAYRDLDGRPIATPISVRAVARGPLQDVVVTLDSVTAGDGARIRVAFVPLSALWIPGLVLLMIGGFLTLWAAPRPGHGA